MLLDIVKYPAEILTTPTKLISPEEINSSEIQALIRDMIDTCHYAGGLGLAANQVGSNKSLFVYMDRDSSNDTILFSAVINPVIVSKKEKMVSKGEGCLSIPGVRFNVKRFKKITLTGLDYHGHEVNVRTKSKKLAVVIQHEMDHLAGITLYDIGKKL